MIRFADTNILKIVVLRPFSRYVFRTNLKKRPSHLNSRNFPASLKNQGRLFFVIYAVRVYTATCCAAGMREKDKFKAQLRIVEDRRSRDDR